MNSYGPLGVVTMDGFARSRGGRALLAACLACAPIAAQAEDTREPAAAATDAAPASATTSPATTAATNPPAPPPEVRTFDVNAYDVDGNTLLNQLAIETAVYPYLGPGRTVDDVEKARAALEKAYQDRGYQSVVVQVPQQSVQAGIIKLHVTETRVGRVRVVGAEYHLPSVVREQVPSIQEGQVPDFRNVQRDMADVNRLPDRRVTPTLKPGRVPGTVDVDIKVSDDLPLHASVEVNNDHSPNTRELRSIATARYDNLWQMGHSISGTWLVAPQQPSNTQVFAGSYRAPIWGTPWSVLAYGYKSDNAVATLGGTNVLGKGFTVGLRGIYQLPYADGISQSINFGVDYKHFDQNIVSGTSTLTTPITYYPLSVVYSLQYLTEHTTTNIALTAALGIRGAGSSRRIFEQNRGFADANFAVFKVDTDFTQVFEGGTEAMVRFAGQIADKPLVSSEQMSLGGFSSVRGYLQSEAVGDDGVGGSFEIRTPSFHTFFGSWFNEWRAYGFADAGHLWVLNPAPEQQSEFSLYSVGLGTRVTAFKFLHGDFAIALPLRSGVATERADPQALFSIKAEF